MIRGPIAPYVASAVSFDGNTYFEWASGLAGVVNGTKGIFSFWGNGDLGTLSPFWAGQIILYSNNSCVGMGPTGGVDAREVGGFLAATTTDPANLDWDSAPGAYTNSIWNHFLFSWDLGFVPGSRRLAMYVNDTLVPYIINQDNDFGPIKYDDAPFYFGTSSPGSFATVGDYADVYVNFTDTIVEAGNTIAEANRRKFITADGKPADPSGFPSNSIILFSGGAATFGTNQGSGGAPVLTGLLTDATTSPSD
jgi:hypothetical protein